jgi:nucleotide-binding universal stress UspA family protein
MAINSMLVPVSLMETRDQAVLAYVCGLEAQSVKRVTVATAVDPTGLEAPVLARELDRARERLAAICSSFKNCGIELETRVVTGEPLTAILALAQQSHIDVICCGTEGKSVVDYLFSGSLSVDLFSAGAVRTMTVRYSLLEKGSDPAELGRVFGRRLVIPTDFSASATRAFLSAFERPSDAMDELHVLHAIKPSATLTERRDAQVLLEGLSLIAKEHDVEATVSIREGEPGDVILRYLTEVKATGVITGQHGKGRLRQAVLGGVSVRLLREAPCPVVVQP